MPNVSIEVAGLAMAVKTRRGTIDILFPDARCVGGPAHSAVLLVDDHPGLIGTPDFVVTLPGAETEYAGWHLRGDVTLEGTERAASLAMAGAVDLKEVAAATRLLPDDQLPITSRVHLTNCSVTTCGPQTKLDFAFEFDNQTFYVYGKTKAAPRASRGRGRVNLGNIKDPFKIVIPAAGGGRQVVTIAPGKGKRQIVLSNLAAGVAQRVHHFGAYYELMADPERRPIPVRQRRAADDPHVDDFPDNPDECRFGFFEETAVASTQKRR